MSHRNTINSRKSNNKINYNLDNLDEVDEDNTEINIFERASDS